VRGDFPVAGKTATVFLIGAEGEAKNGLRVREEGRRGSSEVSQRSDADGRAIRLAMSAISVTQFRRADASIAPCAEQARARARAL